MTMRYEDKYEIGDAGAVYEFKVKLSMRLRGVKISEFELEEETTVAIDEFAEHLRRDYPWVGDVYRTGRSGGWLAIEDAKGQATEEQLDEIDTRVDQARRDFETAIIESFGYTENGSGYSRRHTPNAREGFRWQDVVTDADYRTKLAMAMADAGYAGDDPVRVIRELTEWRRIHQGRQTPNARKGVHVVRRP